MVHVIYYTRKQEVTDHNMKLLTPTTQYKSLWQNVCQLLFDSDTAIEHNGRLWFNTRCCPNGT